MNTITLWAAAAALVCAASAQAQNATPRPAQQPSTSVPTGDVPTTPGVAPSSSHPGQAGSGAAQGPEQTPSSGTGMPRPGTRPGNPPETDRRGPGEGRGGR